MVKMLKISSILCPVDFSDFSDRAYAYAHSLARHYESKLFVQHVVPLLPLDYPYFSFSDAWTEVYRNVNAGAQQRLGELVKSLDSSAVTAEIIIGEGSPSNGILALAEARGVDLIVMGTHGRQGLDRLTMGSVTEKILRKASCPVLVISKPAQGFVAEAKGPDTVHMSRILFSTDFSEHSGRALRYALSLAMEYNAELTLLHVLEGASENTQEASQATRRMEESVPAEAHDWCTVKTAVRAGKPYQEIVGAALEGQAELIVMGVRGRNALDLAVFGSTTHRVIQLGSCPVLVCGQAG
ncbi:MAG: universal stress protein [Acidobacteriota bacterium]|nr:universal stress protein [Acidobacteriota bacterium]